MSNGTIDFERWLTNLIQRFRQPQAPNMARRRLNPLWIVGIVFVIWLLSGIYFVAPDEQGVVVRFGRATHTTEPGPHYHLPWPIERVFKPKVTQVQKVEIGFRTAEVGPPAQYRNILTESLMLTGDENIVDLDFIVQFRIKDAIDYLFNVRSPVATLQAAAESAMRETIGRKAIDDALTTGKEQIQNESRDSLQEILDSYAAGIHVITIQLQDVGPPEAVSDAFKDVISAQQDKERQINEALGYQNDVIPKARGISAETLNEAEAYKETLTRNAEGEAERFNRLYDEYRVAKLVTRKRLYLETLEKILPRTKLIVLDGKAQSNLLPYLPLETPTQPKGGKPQ